MLIRQLSFQCARLILVHLFVEYVMVEHHLPYAAWSKGGAEITCVMMTIFIFARSLVSKNTIHQLLANRYVK